MKLYLSKTSPYARVVRITAVEKQIGSLLELVWVDPWSSPDNLLGKSPLSRVPVLETDQGEPIIETLLILYYLDQHWSQAPALEKDPSSLLLIGLGQALIDTTVQTVVARRYGGGTTADHPLGERRRLAMTRTLQQLEQKVAVHPSLTIGSVSIGVALEYLEFRLPDVEWRGAFPSLSNWLNEMSRRSSFRDTAFS